jgi:Zn ribbon nucleic-acid-binding protein
MAHGRIAAPDPQAVKLADGIRKHGFRKWYERELLQSHAHLVLAILCMIGIFAGVEALRGTRDWTEQAVDIVSILACAAIGVWALRRYLYFLKHAEATAHQADCPHCKAYGRFTLEAEDGREGTLRVCCRKCSHHWTIFD